MNPVKYFFCESVRSGEVIKNRHASHEFTKNVNANLFAGNEAFVT